MEKPDSWPGAKPSCDTAVTPKGLPNCELPAKDSETGDEVVDVEGGTGRVEPGKGTATDRLPALSTPPASEPDRARSSVPSAPKASWPEGSCVAPAAAAGTPAPSSAV